MGQPLDVHSMERDLLALGIRLDYSNQSTPEEHYNYLIHMYNVFIVSDWEVWKSNSESFHRLIRKNQWRVTYTNPKY